MNKTQLRITRPGSAQSSEFVHMVDCKRYEEIRPALSCFLNYACSLYLDTCFRVWPQYLELVVLENDLEDGQFLRLDEIYQVLQKACETINLGQFQSNDSLVSSQSGSNPLPSDGQIEILDLLDAIAHPKETSVAPLHWHFGNKSHFLEVPPKNRLRGIKPQSEMPFSYEEYIKSPVSQQPVKTNPNRNRVEPSKASAPEDSSEKYKIKERLAHNLFNSYCGAIIQVDNLTESKDLIDSTISVLNSKSIQKSRKDWLILDMHNIELNVPTQNGRQEAIF